MDDNFYIGDIVVCIDEGNQHVEAPNKIKLGETYIVSRVRAGNVSLREFPKVGGWLPNRFRHATKRDLGLDSKSYSDYLNAVTGGENVQSV